MFDIQRRIWAATNTFIAAARCQEIGGNRKVLLPAGMLQIRILLIHGIETLE